MRSLISLISLATVFMLSGCGTPPEQRLDAPGIIITGLTATGDTLSLAVRFTNFNAAPLVVTRSTHTLYLDGKRIGRIDDRQPIGIPPQRAIAHVIPLSKEIASEVRAFFAKNPGQVRGSLETNFEITIQGGEDTIVLKGAGGGPVNAP